MSRRASDEELMARVKRGDADAFGELFDRYRRPIFTFIYRMIGDYHRAQDLLQGTFLRVFRRAGEFDESRRFPPWIYRIARDLCLDEIRRRERVEIVPLEEASELRCGGGPDRDVEADEAERMVERALALLPEGQREVLLLRDSLGLSYEEIAEATGASVPAVKSRLHRARVALKEMLKPYLTSGEMPGKGMKG